MTSQQIKDLTGQYIMNTYGRFPVAIDHGQGATLYDPEGNAGIVLPSWRRFSASARARAACSSPTAAARPTRA